MALDFLSKLKKGKTAEPAVAFKRDLGKAASFFRHAETNADSRNYDYAIELYLSGLKHDPDNVSRHEELREVAKRRKVAKGKPPSLKERMSRGGTPMEKMLHAELLWSKNPIESGYGRDTMKHAVAAIAEDEQLHMAEVAYWAGNIVLEIERSRQKPDADILVEVCGLFRQIGAFDKAVEAAQLALSADPQNEELRKLLQDMETENTMAKGKYGEGKEGDFRANIRDADRQRDLMEDDAIVRTESTTESIIERRRKDYEENKEDLDRLSKLVAVLVQTNKEEHEHEAMKLLDEAWQTTSQYKYRVQLGDIRMRQLQRRVKEARAAYEADRDNPQKKKAYQEAALEAVRFELEEFTDRAKNYPTDMGIRFQLGLRYFQLKKFDEAIGEFQKAQGDPRHRALALMYLGQCYLQRDWVEEAIQSLRGGIEAHADDSDRRGKDLHYLLMEALERYAVENRSLDHAAEAQKIASKLLQIDINYRDIRDCMDRLKKLVTTLKQEKENA